MNHYKASGVTVASGASADNAICGLWNPSSSKAIFCEKLAIFKTVAGGADIPKVRRSSARGTSASSVTPGIGADVNHALAPESGAILDLDYSAEPTLVAGDIDSIVTPAATGSGVIWVFTFEDGITIKAGNGLNIVVGSALAYPISRFTAYWKE